MAHQLKKKDPCKKSKDKVQQALLNKSYIKIYAKKIVAKSLKF